MWAACDAIDPGHHWKACDIIYPMQPLKSALNYNTSQGDKTVHTWLQQFGHACMHAPKANNLAFGMWAACDAIDPGHHWKACDIIYPMHPIKSLAHHTLSQGDTNCAHLACGPHAMPLILGIIGKLVTLSIPCILLNH